MTRLSVSELDALIEGTEGVTPGPWRVGPVDDTLVTAPDGSEVAQIDGDYNSPELWPTMEANAAHIARCDPATIKSLAEEVKELREALRPFAEAGDAISGGFGDALFPDDVTAFSGSDDGVCWKVDGEKRRITWGDFRRARIALNPENHNG